jgi:hypothetical protein
MSSLYSSLDLDESVMSGLDDQTPPSSASPLDHLTPGPGPVVDAELEEGVSRTVREDRLRHRRVVLFSNDLS